MFLDTHYNGREFIMTHAFFLDELKQESGAIRISLDAAAVGDELMAVYTDIFGNDLTERFTL